MLQPEREADQGNRAAEDLVKYLYQGSGPAPYFPFSNLVASAEKKEGTDPRPNSLWSSLAHGNRCTFEQSLRLLGDECSREHQCNQDQPEPTVLVIVLAFPGIFHFTDDKNTIYKQAQCLSETHPQVK